ncbi:MDR family MFS transporter [Tsuneonella sp. SYSU-LHT278]|uniref:MDR family MFS transporter n=1 Tax=Tsuneonella sediminis TaxID=3416089 RepID=UPI003F7956A3
MATAASRQPAAGGPLAIPPEEDVAALPVRNTWLVVFGVMLASLLQILDTTIANVAIPHMQASLGATPDEISWVLTSYIVASAVAMPITGWLADRVGSRRLFIASTAGFVVSSMLCGMAQNIEEMVLFRALQGVTGAFIGPLSQAAMLDVNKPSRQAQMMGVWAMGIMIGPILGPLLGGWLTENWNWRWVFYVNVPLGAIALAILLAELPSRVIRSRRFDLFGFSMIALAIAALQMMLDRGAQEDWFDSPEIWFYAVAVVSCGWISVVHLATHRRGTLFNRALFADRNYVVSLMFMGAIGVAVFATMALMPPMLQRLFGYSVIDTGWVLMPRGIGTLVSMQIAGQLTRRGYDPRYLIFSGFLLTALSFWQMSGWSLGIDQQTIVVTGFVQGLGMGLVFISLNNAAFATLAPDLRTEGSSLLILMRSLGASVGISVTTTLLGVNIQTSHADLASHVTPSSTALVDLSAVDRFQHLGSGALQAIDMEINRQAAMVAYVDDFYLMMWISVAVLPLILLMRPARRLPV